MNELEPEPTPSGARNGANRDRLKSYNESLVLHTVRVHQPICKIEIAHQTGLQSSTASIIVDRLLKQDMLRRNAAQRSGRRGRVRVPVTLNPDYRHVIGIALGAGGHTAAVANFNGEIIYSVALPNAGDPVSVVKELGQRLRRIERANPVPIGAIGISCPALVDSTRLRIINSGPMGWRDVDLNPLAARLGCPVFIDNDARLGALAEIWGAKDGNPRNFAYVMVEQGLGVSLVLSGQVYRGWHGHGTELGHLLLDPRGPLCSCGRRGCWQAFVSEEAIQKRYYGNAAVPKPLSLSEIVAQALDGAPKAIGSIRQTGVYLARGLANLSVGLNVDRVVLGGQLTRVWPILEPVIREVLAQERFPIHLELSRVGVSQYGERGCLKGAIALALERYFPSLSNVWNGVEDKKWT